jgi:hypothetical protein
VIQSLDQAQNATDLVGREYDRQFELWICAGQFELGWPGALQGFFPEDFDGTKGLSTGLASYLFVLFEMDEVLAKVFGRELIRGFAVKLSDLANTGVVSLLGPSADGQQLEVVGE